MRTFYSPAERRLMDTLPAAERDVVEALVQAFDAHLIEDVPDTGQASIFDEQAAA